MSLCVCGLDFPPEQLLINTSECTEWHLGLSNHLLYLCVVAIQPIYSAKCFPLKQDPAIEINAVCRYLCPYLKHLSISASLKLCESTSPAFWTGTLTTTTTPPPWNHTHTHTHIRRNPQSEQQPLETPPSAVVCRYWSTIISLLSSNTLSHQFYMRWLNFTRFALYLFNFKATYSAQNLPFDYQTHVVW